MHASVILLHLTPQFQPGSPRPVTDSGDPDPTLRESACCMVIYMELTLKASPVAQWIRIHLLGQGTEFNPWSRRIPHAAELSLCTMTTEPAL